jgi:hypothetical protein
MHIRSVQNQTPIFRTAYAQAGPRAAVSKIAIEMKTRITQLHYCMKDITHEILSEVHHLLSIATEEDLRRAGNLPNMSPHMRSALESLATEKASTVRRGPARATSLRTSRRPTSAQKPSSNAVMNLTVIRRPVVSVAVHWIGIAGTGAKPP